MLGTCEQLAAGMGAGDKKVKGSEKENIRRGEEKVELGNARLRLWVGERFLGGCLLHVTFRKLTLMMIIFVLYRIA
jgi:hypothetical protein